MLNLVGKKNAITIAVYENQYGKSYNETLKDFINENANRLSEDESLQLLIFACSAKNCIKIANKKVKKIYKALDIKE